MLPLSGSDVNSCTSCKEADLECVWLSTPELPPTTAGQGPTRSIKVIAMPSGLPKIVIPPTLTGPVEGRRAELVDEGAPDNHGIGAPSAPSADTDVEMTDASESNRPRLDKGKGRAIASPDPELDDDSLINALRAGKVLTEEEENAVLLEAYIAVHNANRTLETLNDLGREVREELATLEAEFWEGHRPGRAQATLLEAVDAYFAQASEAMAAYEEVEAELVQKSEPKEEYEWTE